MYGDGFGGVIWMKIIEITENKKQYLDLLLLADEQETMIDRYLYKGKMYVLEKYLILINLNQINLI